MANLWRFFASCISSEPRDHISDLHSKFALGPHTMCMADVQSATAEIRRGKKKKRKKEKNDENIMSASATQVGHNYVVIGLREFVQF